MSNSVLFKSYVNIFTASCVFFYQLSLADTSARFAKI